MKKYLLSLALTFIITPSFSQSLDSLIEDASKITVYLSGKFVKTEIINSKSYEIWYKDTSTKKVSPVLDNSSGTGFLVSNNDWLYLVTAEHVAKKLQQDVEIILIGDNQISTRLKLQDLTLDSIANWTYHGNADVAVLSIHPESKLMSNRNFQVIPMDMLYNTLTAPLRRKEVVMVGFPLRLGIGKYFSAISASAKPASGIVDLKRFDNDSIASFFLLDAPSIPGLSGGPVLTIPNYSPNPTGYFNSVDSISCVGLVHGVISDNTGGKFAAIVPSKFIAETIHKTKKFTGVTKYYHSNGKIWAEKIYDNGLLKEVLFNLDINGKAMDKGTLKNGNGTVKNYDESGKLVQIITYENGIAKDIKTY